MILTPQEASGLLEFPSLEVMPEKVITVFLPAVEDFLRNATGRDWGTVTDTYTEIDPLAKMVAGMLLIRWFDDPGMVGKAADDGIIAMIAQLKTKVG